MSSHACLDSILTRLSLPLSSLSAFVTPLALNTPASMPSSEPPVSESAELPAYLAIEFLADAAAEEARGSGREKEERERKAKEAAEVRLLPLVIGPSVSRTDVRDLQLFRSLVEYDPIRREYWRFSARQAEASVAMVA